MDPSASSWSPRADLTGGGVHPTPSDYRAIGDAIRSTSSERTGHHRRPKAFSIVAALHRSPSCAVTT